MKKGNKPLLTLILLFPFLTAFSLNTPPSLPVVPSTTKYEDVEATSEYVDTVDNQQQYKVTFTNTGNDYAIVPHHGVGSHNQIQEYVYLNRGLFGSEAVPPGETRTYSYWSQANEPCNLENFTWLFYKYDLIAEEVTVSDCSIKYYGGNYYTLNGSLTGIGEYVYYAMIDINYDGVRYAFCSEIVKSWENGEKTRKIAGFDAEETLDMTKIAVNKVTVYRSVNPEPKSSIDYGAIWFGLFVVLAQFFPFILLGILAIIIIVMIIKAVKTSTKQH